MRASTAPNMPDILSAQIWTRRLKLMAFRHDNDLIMSDAFTYSHNHIRTQRQPALETYGLSGRWTIS